MTEEAKKKQDAEKGNESSPKKKGGMMKIIMIAGIGIAIIALTAVGTLFVIGGDEPVSENQTTTESQDVSSSHVSNEGHGESDDKAPVPDHKTSSEQPKQDSHSNPEQADNSTDENSFDPNDPSVMESIMEQLAVLDYQPDDSELLPEDVKAAQKDSTAKVLWFEKEQSRLSKWETELNGKEKELSKLNREIEKKIIIIDQAESGRISGLAKLYDGMDPRSVAALMANLDDQTVVSILPRMKSKNAAQVLALLSPRRAAKLSKQMITIAEK